jgi:uncharacterized repeat protein (TIGR03803 family)
MKRTLFVLGRLGAIWAALFPVLSVAADIRAQANFQVLHSFGGPGDGAGLSSALAIDGEGNLYGTSGIGGTYNCGTANCGTVFELSPGANGAWTETVLYNFGAAGKYDGTSPGGSVAIGSGGVLYGVTSAGGTHSYGVVYSLSPGSSGWTESILHSFARVDGECCLLNNVVLDAKGNLYGGAATFELSPGASGWKFERTCNPIGTPCSGSHYDNTAISRGGTLFAPGIEGKNRVGNVYAVAPDGTDWRAEDLYDFGANPTDGQEPSFGPLVTDSAGNIYGATEYGGSNTCGEGGCGTIFKLSRQPNGGWQETILFNFQVPAAGTGFYPIGGVILDKTGNLYGTAGYGGGPCGCGVVYKLEHNKNDTWTYVVLHTFMNTDGTLPYSSLTFDAHGNLYGTTLGGGTYGGGVVFEITPP